MKSFGIAATLGFAFVALMFGQAVGYDAMSAAVGPDLTPAGYDGAAVAVALLVANPVQAAGLFHRWSFGGESANCGAQHFVRDQVRIELHGDAHVAGDRLANVAAFLERGGERDRPGVQRGVET